MIYSLTLNIVQQSLALLITACSNELTNAPYIHTTKRMLAEPAATYQHIQAVIAVIADGSPQAYSLTLNASD